MNPSNERAPRRCLEVALSFNTPDGIITGHTIDVSESGVLVRLDGPVDLWLVGKLSLTAGEYYIEIEARVARLFEDGCGLSFLIENEMDRLSVRVLNDHATAIANGVAVSHLNV